MTNLLLEEIEQNVKDSGIKNYKSLSIDKLLQVLNEI